MFLASQPQAHLARRVSRKVSGTPASDGAGVKLNRVIGTAGLESVDPFLMLDEIVLSDPRAYVAGFPSHPHRGFETITYVLEGRVRHRDNKGNEGVVEAGGAQWMTAGRGIVHSEMPEQADGRMHGFQLWLNLAAADKMVEPAWRDIDADDIPAVIFRNAEVRLLAGRYHGLKGPVDSRATRPLIADISLAAEAEVVLPIPEDHAGFVYVFEGGVAVAQTLINPGEAGLLTAGNVVTLVAGGAPARALVVTGKPLNEPIVRYGPFVMNTHDEIKQALSDYRAGLF
jgi:redox-sensitive bicupin YhaK (pirin superfamily)